MDLEKEYINRFKDNKSLKGIDADSLWEGIAENLNKNNTITKSSKSNYRNIILGIAAMVFLLLGFLFIHNFNKTSLNAFKIDALPLNSLGQNSNTKSALEQIYTDDKKENKTNSSFNNQTIEKKKENATEEIHLVKKNEKEYVSSTKEHLESGQSDTRTFELTEPDNTKYKASNQTKSLPKFSKSPLLLKDRKEEFLSKKQLETDKTILSIDKIEVSSKKRVVKQEDSKDIKLKSFKSSNIVLEENEAINKKTDYTQQGVTVKLKALNIFPISTQPESKTNADKYFTSLPLLGNDDSTQKHSSNSSPFQLVITTGMNTIFTQYKNKNGEIDLLNELKDANKNDFGFSASIRLSRLFKGKFHVGTGIDYDNIWYKFDKTKETKTTAIVKNHFTGISIDPISGDTTAVYEDVVFDAIETRTVLHHNNFKVISIPLEFGIQQQKGKISFGLNLGLSVNFFITQDGKTLYTSGQISTFGPENPISGNLFKKTFFAYHLNPFIDFGIGKKINIRLSPIVKYQAHRVLYSSNLSRHSIFTSFNLGLVYSL